MNVTILVDSRLRGNDSEAQELIPIGITGQITSYEPRVTKKSRICLPACFMRWCYLKLQFFFPSFCFDAGVDLGYCITSNQKL
jgi:hypothetical protein